MYESRNKAINLKTKNKKNKKPNEATNPYVCVYIYIYIATKQNQDLRYE